MLIELNIETQELKQDAPPKSKLEQIIEHTTKAKKKPPPVNPEHSLEYEYLLALGPNNAVEETLKLTTKRYMQLRSSLSDRDRIKLDLILIQILSSEQHTLQVLSDELKSLLNKEKFAVFNHIQNAYLSIVAALLFDQTPVINSKIKFLCVGLHELYSGDQRFYKDFKKSRPAIAKEGGLARAENYLETKSEARRLLLDTAPPGGWTSELEAHKAILPHIKEYIKSKNIRYPAQTAIDKKLRHWIKEDPIVSAAVNIQKT
ncbi:MULTISPECIES: hypothetical protein [Pseudomonas syringae group]|uniref:hypothetical protein n=1 Tax=Pseudomonas syringae group TaxID=136849 RepID=UPI000A8B4E98|nr:hypothetical protein [Pseudomonas coronafaciens]RMV88550.1 hypothetical protein ALP02_200089 [Pseudomonas coronafaciens pv. garcae]